MYRQLLMMFAAWFALGFLVNIATAADGLEKQLLVQAPKLLKELKDAGYKNIGVLKFRVKIGDKPSTDRVGTLNHRLTEKLEMALILANKITDPVGIIHNANATAATIKGATHLTPEGRKLLFTKEYPLAWGTELVKPDLFLTGSAIVSKDLRTMDVKILFFVPEQPELTEVASFQVPVDLEQLLDSGESFTVRGVFDNASLAMTENQRQDKATGEAIKTSIETKSETEASKQPTTSKIHPLSPENKDALLTLTVLYDNKPQKIEFRGGSAFLPEPREGQKVALVVRRKGTTKPRLGVVLKVNGESTLYQEKAADPQCTPWVFEPKADAFGIYGFQSDEKTLKEFKVLSQAASKSKEIDYGEFVGTISISVFREQTIAPKADPQIVLSNDGEDFNILKKSSFPKKQPLNPDALRQQLAQSSTTQTRGIFVDGDAKDSEIEIVKFEHDKIPLMSATLKYYNPSDLPE